MLTYADASGAPGKATADSDVVDARFVDLVPGERVVHAIDFESDDPAFAGTMTMTWTLTEVDGGTRVDIVAQDVPAGISAEAARGTNCFVIRSAQPAAGPRSSSGMACRNHIALAA